MVKLTGNTGVKPAMQAEPKMAEEPVPESPDPSPPSFVVSSPVYCPPSTSPSRLTCPRKKKACYRRCKILMVCVLAFLAVFMFMGASWYVHRLHREAETPPCVYGDEHEDCDREKSKLWLEWLEKSLWMMQHRGEERGRGKGTHRSGPENDTRERPLHREEDNHMDPFVHMMREFRQEMEERYGEMERDGVHPPPPPTSPPPPPM